MGRSYQGRTACCLVVAWRSRDLGPTLDGPDVVGILQEQLLLFQPGDELGPAMLDRTFPVLERAVKESDLRTGM
jgi:hypothetical protein